MRPLRVGDTVRIGWRRAQGRVVKITRGRGRETFYRIRSIASAGPDGRALYWWAVRGEIVAMPRRKAR